MSMKTKYSTFAGLKTIWNRYRIFQVFLIVAFLNGFYENAITLKLRFFTKILIFDK